MRTPEVQQRIESRLLSALRQAGLRLTLQRRAICRVLAQSEDHPTAQDIYRALKSQYPSLSLATVYNTLDALVRLGAVHRLGEAGDDAAHYDADISPHINLACIRCHRVVDFPLPDVARLEDAVRQASGYHILGARMVYYGLCPECQQALNQETQPTAAASE